MLINRPETYMEIYLAWETEKEICVHCDDPSTKGKLSCDFHQKQWEKLRHQTDVMHAQELYVKFAQDNWDKAQRGWECPNCLSEFKSKTDYLCGSCRQNH